MASTFDFYPFNSTREKHIHENLALVKHPKGWWCGYCALTKEEIPNIFRMLLSPGSPNKERRIEVLLETLGVLNVHGDINYLYMENNDTHAVFGFSMLIDHPVQWSGGDPENPVVEKLITAQMEEQVKEFDRRFPEWKKAPFNRQMDILNEIRETGDIECAYGKHQLRFISAYEKSSKTPQPSNDANNSPGERTVSRTSPTNQ